MLQSLLDECPLLCLFEKTEMDFFFKLVLLITKISLLFCSINFKQFEKAEKDLPANSEVLKLLMEQEAPMRGVAGLAELQEDRGATSN